MSTTAKRPILIWRSMRFLAIVVAAASPVAGALLGCGGRDGECAFDADAVCTEGTFECSCGMLRQCVNTWSSDPPEAHWVTYFDCSAAGLRCSGADPSTCESAPGGNEALAVEKMPRWSGYYRDTHDQLGAIPKAELAPTASYEAGHVTVIWPVVVAEDCRDPNAWILRRGPGILDLELVDWEPWPHCNDSDAIFAALARFSVAAGTYRISLTTEVRGFNDQTPPVQPFDVDIP